MSAEQRNREAANELARRAIAAAERRRAENGLDPAAAAERLRDAADSAGRLTVDEAVAALTGADPGAGAFNAAIRAESPAQLEKQRRDRERLFGAEPEPPEPPPRFQGSADGGEGIDVTEGRTYDHTDDGERFRIFSDEELAPRKDTE